MDDAMNEIDQAHANLVRGIRNALLLELGVGAICGAVYCLWWLL